MGMLLSIPLILAGLLALGVAFVRQPLSENG
jgi:prolipoprotein diacylglyceryltransferase